MTPVQSKFVLLRADGIAFDAIAKEIKISKATLIQWSKLFAEEIKQLQFEAFIRIKETYAFNTKQRYETLLKQMNKINDAILDADLSQASFKDLISARHNIILQLDTIEKRITANPHITETSEFGYKENLVLRLNEIE